MPGQYFSTEERAALERSPDQLHPEDIRRCFTLTAEDVALVRRRAEPAGWLAGGLQLGSLRLLGFVPADVGRVPAPAVAFVAGQLGVAADVLAGYRPAARTLVEQITAIEGHLGWRRATRGDLKVLGDWLVERALEHDQPRLLFDLACDRLRAERVARPGITVLERLVATARDRATGETWLRLAAQLPRRRRQQLDALLAVDDQLGVTRLAWLRAEAPAATPAAIKCSWASSSSSARWAPTPGTWGR